ncbi:STAS domain-containing protein [Pseudonocardia sp. H11422]|uniref:STAS domain-containing protein n=1 Tax=Pseudonocardia sp. H11422 TaxID=2835866 RepID=UPI001BDBEF10|nr:STAS domain-containing protein [Pseudonocardia sp. H11422]
MSDSLPEHEQSEEALQIRIDVPAASVAVMTPAGEVDMLTAPFLLERLQAQLERRSHTVVDMCDVTFLGSSGLHTLLTAHTTARSVGSNLYLTGTETPTTARVLRISGLEPVLPVVHVGTDELVTSLTGAADARTAHDVG